MPESTVELLKRAVNAQAKVINKPVGDRRREDEETAEPVRPPEKGKR